MHPGGKSDDLLITRQDLYLFSTLSATVITGKITLAVVNGFTQYIWEGLEKHNNQSPRSLFRIPVIIVAFLFFIAFHYGLKELNYSANGIAMPEKVSCPRLTGRSHERL